MKTDIFTKILLGVIAIAVIGIYLQNMGMIETPKKDVRIVSIVAPNKAKIVQSIRQKNDEWKWDVIDIEANEAIPVEIEEPMSIGSVKVEVTNPEDFIR